MITIDDAMLSSHIIMFRLLIHEKSEKNSYKKNAKNTSEKNHIKISSAEKMFFAAKMSRKRREQKSSKIFLLAAIVFARNSQSHCVTRDSIEIEIETLQCQNV